MIDVSTRWNSSYDMIHRYIELNAAVYSTLAEMKVTLIVTSYCFSFKKLSLLKAAFESSSIFESTVIGPGIYFQVQAKCLYSRLVTVINSELAIISPSDDSTFI